MTFSVRIVSRENSRALESFTETTERGAEKLERGININLDHERYFTEIVEQKES